MLAVEVVVFLGFARLVFGVPFRGPLWELGVALRFDVAGVFGAGAAGGVAREDDGGRERVDEPGDASHVDFVGSVFLGVEISGIHAAAGARAAADGGDRCDARQHAAGRATGANDGADWEFCWRGSSCRLRCRCESSGGNREEGTGNRKALR